MIDQIIAYNKSFVAQKGYEKYLTSKSDETLVLGETSGICTKSLSRLVLIRQMTTLQLSD